MMGPRVGGAIAGLSVLVLPAVVRGADGPAADSSASSAVWLFFFLAPVVFILLWMVVFTRKSGAMKTGGYMEKANEHMDREREHRERIERKTDRMIGLLESIDRKLGERTYLTDWSPGVEGGPKDREDR